MPRVSAIIPNYNHARYLPSRVASVLNQDWPNLEVLLMDDGSTDDSRRVIARYASHPRVRILLNERNSGSTFVQWNRGVRAATGEYIWLAESDDLADPHLVSSVVGAMTVNASCDIGCCESWLMYGDGDPDQCRLEPHHRPGARRKLWTHDFVSDGRTICTKDMLFGNVMPNASAVLFRKELYEAVGGADESMRQSGDRMMWVRMLQRSRLAHVGARLNYYRFHDATVRSRRGASARTITEVYSVLRYIRDSFDVSPEEFERALDQYGRHFAQASAKRGVPLAQMVHACRKVADVDPHVWRRLLAPWALQRSLGPPVRGIRRLTRGAARHFTAHRKERSGCAC